MSNDQPQRVRHQSGDPTLIVEGRWHVIRRGGWWIVDDLHSHPRDTVTGGYLTKREAIAAARAIAEAKR